MTPLEGFLHGKTIVYLTQQLHWRQDEGKGEAWRLCRRLPLWDVKISLSDILLQRLHILLEGMVPFGGNAAHRAWTLALHRFGHGNVAGCLKFMI